jgi:hypothetical protein
MTTWHFGAVGCASLERKLRDESFERNFRPIGDLPQPAPTQRAAEPELEIIKVVRRIHESSHLIVGWALGLKPMRINSIRGLACVEWVVPAGQRAMAGFLISLAAAKERPRS